MTLDRGIAFPETRVRQLTLREANPYSKVMCGQSEPVDSVSTLQKRNAKPVKYSYSGDDKIQQSQKFTKRVPQMSMCFVSGVLEMSPHFSAEMNNFFDHGFYLVSSCQ